MLAALLDWLDNRTGYRALRAHACDEPLPPGTGWTFTTGSVVALLVGVQLATGVGLAMYYVPSPALAYDSLRFLITQVQLGWLLRGLHVWGASFVVVAAVVHLTRAFLVGRQQGAARTHVDHRCRPAPAAAGVLPDRLPAAVGSEGVLGDDRHHQRRAELAGRRRSGWPTCCAAGTTWAR